jgi:hypothetical protein
MPETNLPINEAKLKSLGVTLKKQFTETETLRANSKEKEWLESVRQFKGIYDPEDLARMEVNQSRVYPRYTRSKVQPTVAKLNNLLFPDNDRNFEVRHTPEPRLTEEQLEEIAGTFVDEEGAPREASLPEVEEAIIQYSAKKAQRMTREMDDQLVEMGHINKAKRTIRSGVMLGTGVLKGPLVKNKKVRRVEKTEAGYAQAETLTYRPDSAAVRLWNFFPDMSATELKHCNFVYELHSMTKHELRKLAKRKGFKRDVVTDYVRKHKKGDYKMRNWEVDLLTLKDDEAPKTVSNNYEVLEMNGYLDGHDLVEIGALNPEEKDADRDWLVNVWLLGREIIKVKVLPVEELEEIYHLFYFEKDDSSVFGEGLPKIIRHTQLAICAATRAMLDNAAWVSGPILEINGDLMGDDEDPDDVYPGRVFQREGRGADAQYPAVRVYNIDSRASEYLSIINKLESNGDMESTLPAFLFGTAAKTTNETAKGVSIQQSNTNLTINDIVKQFDETHEKFLTQLYKWNQKYNEDETIKGDMEVKAIGSASLVSKEVRMQALDFFAQTLSEDDMHDIKRRRFLEERIKLHDLGPLNLMNTEAGAAQSRDAQIDREMRELQKLKLESDIRYDHAKAANMESKADATTHESGLNEVTVMTDVIEKTKGGTNEAQ